MIYNIITNQHIAVYIYIYIYIYMYMHSYHRRKDRLKPDHTHEASPTDSVYMHTLRRSLNALFCNNMQKISYQYKPHEPMMVRGNYTLTTLWQV